MSLLRIGIYEWEYSPGLDFVPVALLDALVEARMICPTFILEMEAQGLDSDATVVQIVVTPETPMSVEFDQRYLHAATRSLPNLDIGADLSSLSPEKVNIVRAVPYGPGMCNDMLRLRLGDQ